MIKKRFSNANDKDNRKFEDKNNDSNVKNSSQNSIEDIKKKRNNKNGHFQNSTLIMKIKIIIERSSIV